MTRILQGPCESVLTSYKPT